MTNKEELKQEDLQKVSGGGDRCREAEQGKFILGAQIGQYETMDHIGEEVAVVNGSDSYTTLAYGTLMKSYEASWGCGTRRTVEIKLHPECQTNQKRSSEGYAICFADYNHVFLISYK